ncbi:MAG: ABC transporter ATP-binding protein [Candidatus Saccharimonadales bacterium]
MSQDYAIKVENMSKEFLLPHNKKTSLKQTVIGLVKRDNTYEVQEALKDVSFEIKKGEFFGVVGRNGSGKSTLLKIMAGIYTPTRGSVKVNGTIVPFIELGVGFNPELSGRDNVFLNGALLGFSREEMEEMYDEIVEFAELERFMDQKLKNYSSGMQVRLAFSIAIRAKGDILLLDEVLAVGDKAFQEKCVDVFEKYKASNKTVILVTHSMTTVEEYCDRAMLLNKGLIHKIDNPQIIAQDYQSENKKTYLKSEAKQRDRQDKKTLESKDISIKLLNKDDKEASNFKPGETATIKISWKNPKIKNVGVALVKQTGDYIFGANTILDGFDIKNKAVSYSIKLDLGSGDYLVKAGFFGDTDQDKIDFVNDGPKIIVDSPEEQRWGGVIHLEHEWKS